MNHLTHWGRVTHICVGNLTIIGSDNGLLPGRHQAIIWTNAGIVLIRPLGTNFSEILIGIQTFSFKKMYLKMSSVKWRPFCLGLNVLTYLFNILRPDQNGWCFGDGILKSIFLNGNFCITIELPLKFVTQGPIDKKISLMLNMQQAITRTNDLKSLHLWTDRWTRCIHYTLPTSLARDIIIFHFKQIHNYRNCHNFLHKSQQLCCNDVCKMYFLGASQLNC